MIHGPLPGKLAKVVFIAAILVGTALGNPSRPSYAADPRVVVLGFDGADAKLTQQWMDEGKLPNLAKLRAEGTFSPLRSTIPSQTPVSWSTFSTGLNPGRHAIFDFLKRDTATYQPSFAPSDESTRPFLWGARNPPILGLIGAVVVFLLGWLILKLLRVKTVPLAIALVLGVLAGVGMYAGAKKLLPVSYPVAINRRQGDTFWGLLSNAGKRVRLMRMPVTFPPEPYEHVEMLSGLGTPDISGRIGKPFYFTSELFFQPKGGGDFKGEIEQLLDNKGVIPTEIKGPPNKLFPSASGKTEYISIPMTLSVAEDKSKLDIAVDGTKLTLKPGEWSDWVRFTFPFNSLIKLHGIGRFRLISLEPEIRLYLSPIEFDPENLPPILPITSPGSFAKSLASRFGLYKTKGWTIDTWSISEGTIDEQIFMEDVEKTVAQDRKMLDGLLADDWDVYFQYFEFTDRVQHIMFRFFDPKHPGYTAEGAAKWGGTILKAYQEMDSIVGETMEKMPKDAVLFVASDHGFQSWRRSMNYNTWLAKEGYMVLKGEQKGRVNLEMLFDQGEFFTNVDWSKTRAYAMGLGDLYINLAGREKQGIVKPGADYAALVQELKTKLEAYTDPETGEKPVAHVFTRDEAYGTYDPVLIPDMFLSNSEGWRVGWQDSLGGIAKQITEPNLEVWSGDHCSVYPPLVNGILFSNRKLSADAPYMGDMTPTLLDIYGVQSAIKFDGKSLWKK
ncbi:MAG: alkaline phosphatase family protein [Acidobacteriota bacterium]